MLASRLPGILPPLSAAQAIETAALYSLRGEPRSGWRSRPFRAPHHSATAPALFGGGSTPQPGEISLAHNGVLFLDELPEFNRTALETLREPLETKQATVARARQTFSFPADFQLVAAMNPCPCGFAGDTLRECRCTPDQIRRYMGRISGPLLDRIDIRIQLQREAISFSRQQARNENSAAIRERVLGARKFGMERSPMTNARLDGEDLKRWCWPVSAGLKLLEQAAEQFKLSHRACNRVLRVARTIADLAVSQQLRRPHLAEALSLRGHNLQG
jgi:magnesium chelatase family protein